MLEALDSNPPVDFSTLDPVEERAASEIRLKAISGTTVEVSRVDDLQVGELPVRIYRPQSARHTVMFIHGGGWVVGSLDTHDNSCRILANESLCNVVSTGYRKAPESPFPSGIDDCTNALEWLLKEGPRLDLDTATPCWDREKGAPPLLTGLDLLVSVARRRGTGQGKAVRLRTQGF